MSRTLLHFDFPFDGPWGAEMADQMKGLAQDIATEPGLIWKIWTENSETGRAGGVYLFETAAQADAYREKHAKRLEGFGITGISGQTYGVNEELSKIDRAPL